MPRKKGFYWTEVEDKYFIQWFKGTEKEKVQAYNKLIGKLNYMAKNILHKYYVGAASDWRKEKELVEEAVNHLLLNGNYDESRKTTIYSYASAVIKHRLHDFIVMSKNYVKNIIIDKNYDTSSSENEYVFEDYCETPEFDEFDYSERQMLLNKIITHLNQKKESFEVKLKNTAYRKDGVVYNNIKVKLEIVNLSIEFFNKFFMDTKVGAAELCDYIRLNISDVKEYQLKFFIMEIIGTYTETDRIDRRVSKRYEKIKSTSTYIQDDTAPNERELKAGRKTTIVSGYLRDKITFEELQKYSYF